MSTETQSETESRIELDSSQKKTVRGLLEAAGVVGLFASMIIHYTLAFAVLEQTVGEQLAAGPAWLMVAINTALSIPVMTAMIVCAGWGISVVTGTDPHWKEHIIYGAGAATIVTPAFYALGVVGPF